MTGSVRLDDVDELIREGDAIARQVGHEEARDDARSWIVEQLLSGEHGRNAAAGSAIAALAVWLAWTAPEPHGSAIRAALRSDRKLAVALTSHTVHGKPAVNGRLMVFKPDKPLIDILQEFGLGPTSEFVTQRLAPH